MCSFNTLFLTLTVLLKERKELDQILMKRLQKKNILKVLINLEMTEKTSTLKHVVSRLLKRTNYYDGINSLICRGKTQKTFISSE